MAIILSVWQVGLSVNPLDLRGQPPLQNGRTEVMHLLMVGGSLQGFNAVISRSVKSQKHRFALAPTTDVPPTQSPTPVFESQPTTFIPCHKFNQASNLGSGLNTTIPCLPSGWFDRSQELRCSTQQIRYPSLALCLIPRSLREPNTFCAVDFPVTTFFA